MIENYLRERRLVIIIILEVTNTDQLENFCVDEHYWKSRELQNDKSVRYMFELTGRYRLSTEYAQSILFENEREAQFWTLVRKTKRFVVVQPHATSRASLFIGNGQTCKPIHFLFEEG
jgi:hypothetical protein